MQKDTRPNQHDAKAERARIKQRNAQWKRKAKPELVISNSLRTSLRTKFRSLRAISKKIDRIDTEYERAWNRSRQRLQMSLIRGAEKVNLRWKESSIS